MKEPGCGCCAGTEVVTPVAESNRPGLNALNYRAGTYGTFLESMFARISSLALEVPATEGSSVLQRIFPLRTLTTRELSDPSIAMMDAWATLADVLTFSQERIANEGYLRTATEHRSVLELARLVGYRLRPGVSASVYLAFTAAGGFNGVLPAGTRAQSISATGAMPQFFETSEDLPARDVWNSLKTRTVRPQVITFSSDPTKARTEGTDAKTRDTIYFTGISTNLKAGDFILIVAGEDPTRVALRSVVSAESQTDYKRTEVVLDTPPVIVDIGATIAAAASAAFQPYIDDAASIFPNIELASNVSALLTNLLADIDKGSSFAEAADLALGVQPQIVEWHGLAVKRHFTRLEPWLADLLETIQFFRQQLLSPGGPQFVNNGTGELMVASATTGTLPTLIPLQTTTPNSPLGNLGTILDALAQPPSLQPANSLKLNRSVQQVFGRQADIAPRLLASFRPEIAPSLYAAWGGIKTASATITVHAIRVKAGLFAASSNGLPTYTNNQLTGFADVTLRSTWGALIGNANFLPTIALDGPYDKIATGSWVAIDRPLLDSKTTATTLVTYHQVTAVRTITRAAEGMSATGGVGPATGFSSKTTQLTLNPPWLSDMATSDEFGAATTSTEFLRGTVVYAQTEALELADEPLDNDVEGNKIELAELYDGLDSGRWIIVSGERTDIPNTTGVTASELVMIASVTQGAHALLSIDFPQGIVPFSQIYYTTDANASGDRLVVGAPSFPVGSIPLATVFNQQYADQVKLSPGVFATAYVPTAAESTGDFGDFDGLLVDPQNSQPFLKGMIPKNRLKDVFAWRTSTQPIHTTLTLANALSYHYDPATVTIYANVVKATNGQTTGEVLGSGDASQPLQTFSLHQAPLTYLAAPSPFGAQSTLTVRVNEIAWKEADNLVALGPRDRNYITQTDDADQTTLIFGTGEHGARVPTGSGNVKAVYRYGTGSLGNVDALAIGQLASQPLGAKGVINPLRSSGGADGDTTDQARRNIPIALLALDRLVSVQDYAYFARAYAGIAKASSTRISDGRRLVLHLTIAGNGDVPIDPNSDLYRNLVQALLQYGDPYEPIQLAMRSSKLLVISAGVKLLPDYQWESVSLAIRAALLNLYSFESRELGQSAFLSEAIAAMQSVEGVQYVDVTTFDAVDDTATTAQIAGLGSSLGLHNAIGAELARIDPAQTNPAKRILPAQLVTLAPDIADTLILTEIKV